MGRDEGDWQGGMSRGWWGEDEDNGKVWLV